MILIPEQVKAIRDRINELQYTIDNSTIYFDEVMTLNDKRNKEEQIRYLHRILEESEFVERAEDAVIDYGTKFVIKFSGENQEEIYTLAENEVGLNSGSFNQNNGYVSTDGLLGNNVKGKKEGDTFRYKVKIKGRKDSITISGKILKVFRKTKNDMDFIISRPMSERFATRKILTESIKCKENEVTLNQYMLLKEEKTRLSNLLLRIKKYENRIMVGSIIKLKDKSGNIKQYTIVDKDDYDIDNEINANNAMGSRLFAKHEGDYVKERFSYIKNGKDETTTYNGEIIEIDNSNVLRLANSCHNLYTIKTRLSKIDRLLEKVKIIKGPTNDRIGIGSKVSIMTFENGEVQNKRVEVINKALSSEDNYSYIELNSTIGSAIIGLKSNDNFSYYNKDGSFHVGIVYDVNNNMQEVIASDPLAYQKRRKG